MADVDPIFSLPELTVEKVKLSEVIELLRDRVNKGYMPSATGYVKYNTKPDYVRTAHPDYPDMPNIHPVIEWTGYYSLYNTASKKHPIFFNLNISRFQIMINLETEKALVRLNDSKAAYAEPFIEWNDSDAERLPIMRDELRNLIETYG